VGFRKFLQSFGLFPTVCLPDWPKVKQFRLGTYLPRAYRENVHSEMSNLPSLQLLQ